MNVLRNWLTRRVLCSVVSLGLVSALIFPLAGAEPADHLATQPAPGEGALPQIGVYRWVQGTDNVDAFARWVGHADAWAEVFTNNESWENIEKPGWLLEPE